MTELDVAFGALCAWRENRGGGRDGMQSVLNVLANRARRQKTCIYTEAVRPEQFSSMTDPHDVQLWKFGHIDDPLFDEALRMARLAADSSLEDLTGGATHYYAATMTKPPAWAALMIHTCDIQGQRFFKRS